MLALRSLHPLFAAELTGLDLTTADDASFAAVHDAWLSHAVLVVRGQELSPDGQLRVTERLARLEAEQARPFRPWQLASFAPPTEARPVAGWHSDHSYDAQPGLACLLHAPPGTSAGALLFADQHAAWAALPAPLQSRLAELRAEHGEGSRSATHPLVRLHPVTGRASLYVNPCFTRRILNLPEAESRRLLAALCAAATDAAVIYRHPLRAGDLVIVDNRAVLHRAGGGAFRHQAGEGAFRHQAGEGAAPQRSEVLGDQPAGTHAVPWVVAG